MRLRIAKSRAGDVGGAPHPPEGAQIEGCDQHGPLGRHVGEAAQQEPPCPLLLLDDSEDCDDEYRATSARV